MILIPTFLPTIYYCWGALLKNTSYDYVGSDEPAPDGMGGFDDKAIRRGFIRKVWLSFYLFINIWYTIHIYLSFSSFLFLPLSLSFHICISIYLFTSISSSQILFLYLFPSLSIYPNIYIYPFIYLWCTAGVRYPDVSTACHRCNHRCIPLRPRPSKVITGPKPEFMNSSEPVPTNVSLSRHLPLGQQKKTCLTIRMTIRYVLRILKYLYQAFRIRIHPDPLHLAGSGSTLILASDPDPDPLRFLFPDQDPDPAKCSGSG